MFFKLILMIPILSLAQSKEKDTLLLNMMQMF